MITPEWKHDAALNHWVATVKGLGPTGTEGELIFTATPRPHYCNRGRWLVFVVDQGLLDVDGADGFPRYYFKLETMRSEIETFANARAPIKKYQQAQQEINK